MSRQIEMIVFDLDGTLIDSKHDIAHAVNRTLMHFGVGALTIDLISKYVGTGVMPLIQATLKEHGISEPNTLSEIFANFYLERLTVHTKLYDGMREVLEHFTALRKVILTNKSNQFAHPILKQLKIEHHFARCYGRESFPTRKPDAGPLLAIASEFNISPQNIAMVGDTEVDMIAGKGAGTITVAANYGFGDRVSLNAQNPDFQISKPIELKVLFHKAVS